MIVLIEPTYDTSLLISPIAPIYKSRLKKQPSQDEYSQNMKTQKLFKEILSAEMSMGLGTKISLRV